MIIKGSGVNDVLLLLYPDHKQTKKRRVLIVAIISTVSGILFLCLLNWSRIRWWKKKRGIQIFPYSAICLHLCLYNAYAFRHFMHLNILKFLVQG